MDNKSTTKRMIGAVVLVLIAALLLAWLLQGKNRPEEERELIAEQTQDAEPIIGFPPVDDDENMQTEELAIGLDSGGSGRLEGGSSIGSDAGNDASQTQASSSSSNNNAAASSQNGTTNNTTGLEIRDPQADNVRQVIVDGQEAPGVGSMGASESAAQANANDSDAASSDAADASGNSSDNGNGSQSSGSQTALAPASDNQAANGGSTNESNASRSASSQDRANTNNRDEQVEATRTTPDPRLVDERPVPPPSGQSSRGTTPVASTSSSSSSSASSSSSSSGSSSSSSSSSAPVSSASASSSGYVIQLVATSSRNRAEGVRRSIAAEGYPAFVAEARVDGKNIYRVRVGSYPNRGDARSVQARMKARYQQNQYVQSSFVTKN